MQPFLEKLASAVFGGVIFLIVMVVMQYGGPQHSADSEYYEAAKQHATK